MPRPLYEIAEDISSDWTRVHFGAEPYLAAMERLETMQDWFGDDSASYVVRYFLSNATTWRGPVARAIKAELNQMLED